MRENWLSDPERVTPERVAEDVLQIAQLAAEGEDQLAHDQEAALHAIVLGAIARGILAGDVARASAAAALQTLDIEFKRWPA